MRTRRLQFERWLICVLLLLRGVAARASAMDCAEANALLARGEYTAARARYEADANKSLPCAVTALTAYAARRAEATKHVELAKIAEARKRAEDARNEYLAAINADPTFLEPIERLQRLVKPAVTIADPFRDVRRLIAEEKLDDARKALKEIEQTNPTVAIPPEIEQKLRPYSVAQTFSKAGDDASALTQARVSAAAIPSNPWPPELLYLNGGSLPWWRSIKLWFSRTGAPLLEFFASVFVAVMIIYVVAWMLHALERTTLQIDDFADTPAGTGVIGAPPASPDLTALVREALGRMTLGLPSFSVAIVREPIALPELPATLIGATPASVASWVNAAISLLRLISPVNQLQVSGQLHQGGKRGAGLTLVLTRNRRVEATTTIWQKEFDPDFLKRAAAKETSAGATLTPDRSALYALAEPAAVWLLFQVAQADHA
jgi:tetratricopeptide (TPR) repeat protein